MNVVLFLMKGNFVSVSKLVLVLVINWLEKWFKVVVIILFLLVLYL